MSSTRLERGERGPGGEAFSVYVTNFPTSTTAEDLQRAFARFGRVLEVRLESRLARSFAFVDFEREEDFARCLREKDDIEINGSREINVQRRRPEIHSVFVSPLPMHFTREAVRDLFPGLHPLDVTCKTTIKSVVDDFEESDEGGGFVFSTKGEAEEGEEEEEEESAFGRKVSPSAPGIGGRPKFQGPLTLQTKFSGESGEEEQQQQQEEENTVRMKFAYLDFSDRNEYMQALSAQIELPESLFSVGGGGKGTSSESKRKLTVEPVRNKGYKLRAMKKYAMLSPTHGGDLLNYEDGGTTSTLYVTGIPPPPANAATTTTSTTQSSPQVFNPHEGLEAELKETFSRFGTVISVRAKRTNANASARFSSEALARAVHEKARDLLPDLRISPGRAAEEAVLSMSNLPREYDGTRLRSLFESILDVVEAKVATTPGSTGSSAASSPRASPEPRPASRAERFVLDYTPSFRFAFVTFKERNAAATCLARHAEEPVTVERREPGATPGEKYVVALQLSKKDLMRAALASDSTGRGAPSTTNTQRATGGRGGAAATTTRTIAHRGTATVRRQGGDGTRDFRSFTNRRGARGGGSGGGRDRGGGSGGGGVR